ncbi:MAG: D-aspartate ligase [Polaribacter sp.]|jgi:D-aspartate ligase
MDAIVLGLGVNGLAVVRSLGEKSLRVAGIYHDKNNELGIHSRYLKKIEKISVSYTKDELLTACLKLVETKEPAQKKAVIFCTSDSFAATISKHQSLFEQHFIITTPDKDMYWHFVAKQPTADICTTNNFPIPKTIYCTEKYQLLIKAQHLTYPLIIKPNLTFGDEFPGKNLIVHTKDELGKFISDYPQLETEVVVQEIVPSGDGKIYLVTTYSDKAGKVRIAYSGKKIRQYLPDYGVTCFGVSESNKHLKQITIQFLEAINYTGYATLEFAYDEKNKRFYFIELNIRSFYHNQLFKDASLDINYLAYQLEAQTSINSEQCLMLQKDGIFWLDFTRDFGSFLRKKHLTTLTWLKSLLKARSFAYFDKKDIKPFIVSLKVFTIIVLKNLFQNNR